LSPQYKPPEALETCSPHHSHTYAHHAHRPSFPAISHNHDRNGKAVQYEYDTTATLVLGDSEFRTLLDERWSTPNFHGEPHNTDENAPSEPVLHEFLTKNGYIGSQPLPEDQLLDNVVHPNFRRSNWIVNDKNFDEMYKDMAPALRLVSKFLKDPYMLKWWIYLLHGRYGFVRGWVGLQDNAREHTEKALSDIYAALTDVANRDSFVVLKINVDLSGLCCHALNDRRRVLAHVGEDPAGSRDYKYRYNPWDRSRNPVIAISQSMFYRASEGDSPALRFRHKFNMARILLHELAHACMAIWHPEPRQEILVQSSDLFPESGHSFEQFAFGGNVRTSSGPGPSVCGDLGHDFSAH
jgi:hypothetical protein